MQEEPSEDFFFSIRFNRELQKRSIQREEAGPSSSSSTEQRSRLTRDNEEQPQASTSTAGDRDQGEDTDAKKDEEDKDEMAEAVLTEEDLIQQSQADYDSGRYSPTPLTSSELPLDSHTITPEEDLHRLQLARRQLQVTGRIGFWMRRLPKCLFFLPQEYESSCLFQVMLPRAPRTSSYAEPERAWATTRPSSA